MRITISTGNAAFHDGLGKGGGVDAGPEAARILRKLADRVESCGMPDPGDPIILMDINGNRVGKAEGH